MKDFKIRIREFDKVLKQALAQAYAYRDKYENEFDFKHELFHRLHGMEINGYKLGHKLPDHMTCMLHSEARPKVGVNRRADLLVCNPTVNGVFNYKVEVVMELKLALDTNKLDKLLDRISKYNDGIRKLYIASANSPKIDRASAKRIASEHMPPGTSIEVLDRNSVPYTSAPQSHRRSTAKIPLSERVAKCVTTTLNLYGKNRKDIRHGFFWRNYEPLNEGDWTFPSDGDFVCQLYHRLRTRLRQSATIHTEYHPPSAPPRKLVDLFVEGASETVGIEVKKNYDNLFRGDEIPNILQKFDAMSHRRPKHTNFLVVIQGEHAHRVNREGVNRKADSLDRLRHKRFELFHYDEIRNKAIGPVSAEEAQKLAIR